MASKVWTGITALLRIAPSASDGASAAPREASERHARLLRSRPPSKLQAAALDTYKEAIAAGRVHLLDLGAIKADLREQWDTVKDRVTAAVEGILRQRLTVSDLHSRIDDASYLLVLHSRTEAEARMLCGMIALEVKHKLFGEDRELGEIKISTAAASEDGTVDLVEIDASEAVAESLKARQLAAAAKEAQAREDAAPASVTPVWHTFSHASAAKPSGELVPVKDAFRALDVALNTVARGIEMPQAMPPAAKQPVYGPGKAETEVERARRMAAAHAIEESRRKADAAAAAAASAAIAARHGEEPADVIDSVSFAYVPIWDCRGHAVTKYSLNVKFQVGDTTKSMAEIENWASRPEILASIDALLAKKGIAELTYMIAQGHKAILSLPLHRMVLEHPTRRGPILSLFGTLPPHVRKLIQIEIVDAYAGDWALLPALLATCRRICRDVTLRLSLDQFDVARVRSAGAQAVGGDLLDHPWREAAAMKKLDAFAAAASEAGLETYVHGLSSMSEVVCAACVGFRHLSGPAVAAEVDFPTGVYALDSVNLFLRTQRRGREAS
jgi:hypothetical protein